MLLKQLKITVLLFILLVFITGIAYPAVVTLIAQTCFPWRANGSLISQQGHIIGSELIGQSFTAPKYFWGRPSATSDFPYNALASGASNVAVSDPTYLDTLKKRIKDLSSHTLPVPIDLITASGSGLDPDISPYAAMYQVSRIAAIRHVSTESLSLLIAQATSSGGHWGEAHVNVLRLNMALDALGKKE